MSALNRKISHFQDWVPGQSKLAKQLFDRSRAGGGGRNVSINYILQLSPPKGLYFVVTDSNNHHPILKVRGGRDGGEGGLRGAGGLFVDFATRLTDHICSWTEPLARSQRRPFDFESGKPGCRLDYDAIFNPPFSLARYCSSLAS